MNEGIDSTARSVKAPAPVGLRSGSFLGLLLTQFLGATNDNTFRFLVIGICTPMVAKEHSSLIVSVGLACFTLPYLLLTALAGYLAARFSKRRVIIVCKIAGPFVTQRICYAVKGFALPSKIQHPGLNIFQHLIGRDGVPGKKSLQPRFFGLLCLCNRWYAFFDQLTLSERCDLCIIPRGDKTT